MSPKVLLVNPPVYDFSAYDFWLKPHGVLAVGGSLRGRAEIRLFDFLDRCHPRAPDAAALRRDGWGRGELPSALAPKPDVFKGIPRRWRRFGLPREAFADFLLREGPFDFALVQTQMTYWYPGVREVIEDLRKLCPAAKIVLGGVYATLCSDHAAGLGADLVVEGSNLEPLWGLLGVRGDLDRPPLWEACSNLEAAAMKLTDGCPFRCTYCSVPLLQPVFSPRPAGRALTAFDLLCRLGVGNIAFYDDALLFEPERALLPFLEGVSRRSARVNFHTPNALHARLMTGELAGRLVRGGFKTFYLGFESASAAWQRRTGGKVGPDDLAGAVEHLLSAGADRQNVTAYVLLAHPGDESQRVQEAMRFAHGLGIRVMLAEFSPIPGTPDGQAAAERVDATEPLWHNKTAYAIAALGAERVNRLKQLCRELNGSLPG